MPSPATDTTAIIRDMCSRSSAGFSDVLVVGHHPKFTSEVFRAFVKSMGSCLIVGSAYHKNTNAEVERTKGVFSDTLRAYATGRKDDRDGHLTLAEFAINNAASTLGENMTPFFIDRLPSRSFRHTTTALPASRRRRPGALRAAHAGHGGDGAGAARSGAGGAEGKTRRGPGRDGVQGGRLGAAAVKAA